MKRISWLLAILILGGLELPARAASLEDSVVKIYATMRLPNPIQPWLRQNAVEVTGSGVVIDGQRILTNAHVVTYASEIFVQAREGGERYEAKVKALGPGIDLALVELDDTSFFETRPALARAELMPEAMASVVVYGFPVGGNSLSVTKGIISRIEYAGYNGRTAGLRIQVDAAINPGNSGGPALVDDKMVGLIFSHLGQAEGIGYIIPNEEIEVFLADVEDGKYDGKPLITDQFQTLVNPALRAKLGLEKKVTGVMVRQPASTEPSYPLREYDVATKIGDYAIDNEGMVQVRANLRLPFSYLVPKLAREGNWTIPFSLLRAGQSIEISLPVPQHDTRLIRDLEGGDTSWFIHGPLVFSTVVADAIPLYLRMNPFLQRRSSALFTRRDENMQFAGEELVVVTSPLLRHKISKGYGEPVGQVVSDVNGVKIQNLRHLVETLRDCRDEYVTFHFSESLSETLVFKRQELLDATPEIMAQYSIGRRASEDILPVWSQAAAN